MNKSQAGKFLSQALRELASEPHDTDGSVDKTRAECLAEFVWNSALGYTKKIVDNSGMMVDRDVPPQTWAVHLIFDRMEGKVGFGDEAVSNAPTMAQRLDKIDTENLNSI